MKANTKSKTSENIFLTILLGLILALPIAAEAGKCHHRSNHTHYHFHDGYGHSHYRHHPKRHKHKRHYGGYNRIHNPPQYYYNQPYYSPQPGYNSGRGHNVYPPAPVYVYPPNRMIGISTGNGSFMLRY